MSRLSKNETIGTKEILFSTNNGIDIYNKELSLTKKGNYYVALCPFHKEKSPSFTIKNNGYYKCYGCNEHGNVFNFIQKRYNLDFIQAKEYILKDLSLTPINQNTPIIKKNTKITYDFEPCEWTQKAKDYYCIEGLTPEFLEKEMDIYNICRYSINKNIKHVPSNNLMFCYEYKDITGKATGEVKLLNIGKTVSKLDKWKTNLANDKLWYLYKIKQTDKLIIITKSVKDSAILWRMGIPSIATQSENAKILSENIPKLKKLFPNSEFCVLWGSDEQAVKECIAVTNGYNLHYFNTPKKFLANNINDPFSFVKEFGKNTFLNLFYKKFDKYYYFC